MEGENHSWCATGITSGPAARPEGATGPELLPIYVGPAWFTLNPGCQADLSTCWRAGGAWLG